MTFLFPSDGDETDGESNRVINSGTFREVSWQFQLACRAAGEPMGRRQCDPIVLFAEEISLADLCVYDECFIPIRQVLLGINQT